MELDAQVGERLATAVPIRMTVDPDPAERAKLIALGYVIPNSTIDMAAAVEVGGVDPKDAVQSLDTLATAMKHFADGENEQALEVLAPLGDGSHVNAPRARIARKLGRYEESLEYARLAVQATPSWAEGHLELGNTLVLLGREEEAIAAFEFAKTLDPGNPSAHLQLGTLQMVAGNLEEAAVHLQRAVDGNALVEDAYWRLAAIRFGQGREAEANALLAGLPKALISEPPVVRNLAAGEVMAGDIKGARKRVRLALRRHPKANDVRAYAAELAAYELELKAENEATPE